MDFSEVKTINIPEGSVMHVQDKDGNYLWHDIEKVSYGVRWDSVNKNTSQCERIGNINMHKELPILNSMKVCVYKDKLILYYCDPNDSRFVYNGDTENNIGKFQVENLNNTTKKLSDYYTVPDYINNIPQHCIPTHRITINDDVFNNYKHLWGWIKVNKIPCQVIGIDFGKYVYIMTKDNIESGSYDIVLGTSINGFDGSLGVSVGNKQGFYLWSEDNNGEGNEVRISWFKCKPYAEYIPPFIVSQSSTTFVVSEFLDKDKWGYIGSLPVGAAVSVCNYANNMIGANGVVGKYDTHSDEYDLTFRTNRCKPTIMKTLAQFREAAAKTNQYVLSYTFYKALCWLYVIEYANFNVHISFNSKLTNDGFKQGGLGTGVSNFNNCNLFNANRPIVTNDCTLSLGNNTGVVPTGLIIWNYYSATNTTFKLFGYIGIDYTLSEDNKKIIINSVSNNTSHLYISSIYLSGKIKYRIEGLSNDNAILLKNANGETIFTLRINGIYILDYGNLVSMRYIYFSKPGTYETPIKITILEQESAELVFEENSKNVARYRGINKFFYGDIWCTLEGVLKKYDNDSKKHVFYIKYNPKDYSDDIDTYTYKVETDYNYNSYVKEFVLGKTADFIPKSNGDSSYKNVYSWNISTNVKNKSIILTSSSVGNTTSIFNIFSNGISNYSYISTYLLSLVFN